MCLATGKKPKGSGVAVVDSIFNDSTQQKERVFWGAKSGGYHDSKNNISILDHLPEATTNCRSEWNISLGIHGQEFFFFFPLFLEGGILIVAAAVATVA